MLKFLSRLRSRSERDICTAFPAAALSAAA